jgi:hypothetical protein
VLFLAALVGIGYWWLVWPRVIALLFHSAIDGGRLRSAVEELRRRVGLLIFGSASLLVAVAWGLLRFAGSGGGPGVSTQAAALGVGLATTFVYATLIPPAVSVMTHWVVDPKSGAYDSTHLRELRLVPGNVTPIFVGLFNAGISTWSDFRITVRLPDGFSVSKVDARFGASDAWAWGQGPVMSISPNIVQVIRAAPLAAGEPQIVRLFVTSPSQIPSGERLHVVVTTGGRFGEGSASLPIVQVPSLPWDSGSLSHSAPVD